MPESSGAQEIRVSANADSDTVQEPISKVPVPETIPADKTAELEEFSGVVTTPTKNHLTPWRLKRSYKMHSETFTNRNLQWLCP